MEHRPGAAATAAAGKEWTARHSARANARRAADLVNALAGPRATGEEIAGVLRRYGEPEPLALTPEDVAALGAAARRLREVFAAGDTGRAVTVLNGLLAADPAPFRLTSHHGTAPWHPHLDSADDAPWDEWFLSSSALALAVLIWDHQRPPGGVCASAACDKVFVALGSGPPRRYCSPRCATRERVAAHRRLSSRS